jgi:prolipoprotein diacylglyceryltransferase
MLILHGFTRVIYEFWRAGTDEQVSANLASSTYWHNFPFHLQVTQAQVMAGCLMLIGVVLMVLSGKQVASAQSATAEPQLA